MAKGCVQCPPKAEVQPRRCSREGQAQIGAESRLCCSRAVCPWELLNFLTLSFLIWPTGEPLGCGADSIQ